MGFNNDETHTQANIFFKPEQIWVNVAYISVKETPHILFQSEIKTEFTRYFYV